MRPLDVVRLTLWREIRGRRALYLALPVSLALPAVLSEADGTAWSLFVLAVVLPLVAVALGGGGDPAADRWWAGLGGSLRVRAWARLGLHAALLGAAVGVLYLRFQPAKMDGLMLRGMVTTVIIVCCALGVLCTSAAVARRSAPGFAAVAGPIFAGGCLVLGGMADDHIGAWSVAEGALLRLVPILALGVAVVVRMEGRRPGWRAQVGYYGGVLAISAALSLLHLGWSGRPPLLMPVAADVSADRSTAIFVPQPALLWSGKRALLWSDERWSTVGPIEALDAAVGPNGSVAVITGSPFGEEGPVILWLRAPNGGEHTCALQRGRWGGVRWAFRADGGAVAARLGVGDELGAAVVTDDDGCRFEPGAPQSYDTFAWEGDTLRMTPADADPDSLWGPAQDNPGLKHSQDGVQVLPGSQRRLALTWLDLVWP